jgi:hypothetical protein
MELQYYAEFNIFENDIVTSVHMMLNFCMEGKLLGLGNYLALDGVCLQFHFLFTVWL